MIENAPLKRVAQVIAGQSPPPGTVGDILDGLPFIQGNAEFGKLTPAPRLECKSPPKTAADGDILISVRAPVGAINIASGLLGIGRGVAAIRAFAIDSAFLRYGLESLVPTLISRATGTTFQAINSDDIGSLPIPHPALADQRRIADFLDDQVARIDNIVAAREKHAELARAAHHQEIRDLIEKPTAPRVPLYTVVRWQEGPGILAKDFRLEGIPILRIPHLRTKPPSLAGCDFVDKADGLGRWRHFLTEVGELILSGSASVGELAVWVTPDIAGAIPYTGLIKLRARVGALDPSYMQTFFSSRVFGDQIDLLKSGIGIQHWGPSHLSQVKIPLPSLRVQESNAHDAAELEASAIARDTIIGTSINLMNELKRSLITAAVTGEFDVTSADGSQVPV